jgi:hypothetical protein
MDIVVGNVVTRWDPYTSDYSCENDETGCIGVVVEIDRCSDYSHNPGTCVNWVNSCTYHVNKLYSDMWYTMDQLSKITFIL